MSTLFWRHPGEADLALFAGGELGPLARWRIEGHLHDCDECRQTVGDFFEMRSRVMDLAELPQLDWSALAAGIHRQVAMSRAALEHPAPVASSRFKPAWTPVLALAVMLVLGAYVTHRYGAPPATGAVSLNASAGAVELRVGDRQVLTLTNGGQEEEQVNWRVSADAVSARYLDADTGNITVNNVYTQ